MVSRISFGNIRMRSLIDIWKGEDYASFRALLRGLDGDESTASPNRAGPATRLKDFE